MRDEDMLRKVVAVCTCVSCIYAYSIKSEGMEGQTAAIPTAVPTVVSTIEPTVEPTIEPIAVPTVAPTKEVTTTDIGKIYPSIPLHCKFQAYIENLCKEYGVSTNVVMAVIERESSFNTTAMGDNGQSFGLMQIWRTHHIDRCEKIIGSSKEEDLLYCYNNVAVGIDFLAECYSNNNKEWHKALMAYNGGQGYCNKRVQAGKNTSEYSVWVMAKAEEYKSERVIN